MDAFLAILLLCVLLVPVMYFMLREATYEQRTLERPQTNDGWFTGGSWNTGWYGPGTDFGIGPPPRA